MIAGAGRLEALRANGASASSTVPCVVVDVDDARATLLSLVENTVREAMTPLEEAEVARTLIEVQVVLRAKDRAVLGRLLASVRKNVVTGVVQGNIVYKSNNLGGMGGSLRANICA